MAVPNAPHPPDAPIAVPAIDLDTLTPEQAWEVWQPVSDEYIRRIAAGQEASIDQVAAEFGVPLAVGSIAALSDEAQEGGAREWIEALAGDALP